MRAPDLKGLFASDALAQALSGALADVTPVAVSGRVNEAVGTLIKASGINAHVGEVCELRSPGQDRPLIAEVVGFSKQFALLTPFGPMSGVSASTEVIPSGRSHRVPVGDGLLGRVVDGFGAPMDGQGPVRTPRMASVYAEPPHPLARRLICEPLHTGVRIVDALLTTAHGQRMGIFAPAGVGKSTLMGMLARWASCDVNVIALIGERGREVGEFLHHNLGSQGLAKSVVVVATSDKPAMERAKAAYVATTMAEAFRERGMKVLLLMDSVTRFARALREIGLSSGEPPARRGFPPSIFAALPQLLERAGQGEHGSITAFYTILTEGDDGSDPIAEEVRSILDGHIVLSRKLAALNRYPAIDPLDSLSRVMTSVTSRAHQQAAGKLRSLIAKHQEIELLLRIGEYKPGGDPLADEAVAKIDAIRTLLMQESDESADYDDSLDGLQQLAMG
jgi:ATP synthase in type III secretion protein N